jgi:opacity protein-like surface antigen
MACGLLIPCQDSRNDFVMASLSLSMNDSSRNPQFGGFLMKQQHGAWAISGICAMTLMMSSLVLEVPNAYPEAYIGGQIGTTIAMNKLKSVDLTDFSPNGSMSDRSLSRSLLLGFKLGYFFPQARWFGLETEVYHMTPGIKQQNTTVSIPPGAVLNGFGPVAGGSTSAVLSGDNFRVITWVPVNLMFRYHKTRLQPYVGAGPGVFFARVKTTDPLFAESNSSTRFGFNAKAGLEYYFTRHITAFGEVKYNRIVTDFNFSRTNNFSFSATYHPVLISFGVNFHF